MKKFGLLLIIIIFIFGGLFLYNNAKGKNTKNTENQVTSTTSADSITNSSDTKNKTKNSPSPTPTTTKTISGDFTDPIYMYHYIRVNPDQNDKLGKSLSVSPSDFDGQIKYLKDNGYEIVNLNKILIDDGKKKAVITFDDGYKDALDNAFPVLQKYNATGTIFIIPNKVGTDGYLNWDEIRTLKNAGWEIGSHTVNHPNLTQLSTNEANKEITESKTIIEKEMGSMVESFCYPAGRYSEEIVNQTKNAGYKYATTTVNDYRNSTNDLLELSRIRICGEDGVSGFIAKTP